MNPLTLVKRIQSINAKEADLGISDGASWHAKYKDSAYVFVGGIPYDLTEGDLLAVFAQYGEIVDVNLVREKSTGKSKGFAFVAYEDQRSTVLAVDNLNGAQIAGRTIRVDHVSNYKKKEEEDEETERQKREERGVCRAFQKGECKYGDSCKFSHDEQRAANTGWGPEEERNSRMAFDRSDNRPGNNKRSREAPPSRAPEPQQPKAHGGRSFNRKDTTEIGRKQNEAGYGDQDTGDRAKRLDYKEDRDKQTVERRSSRYDPDSNKSRDDYGGREERKSRKDDIDTSDRGVQNENDRDRGSDRHRDRDRERGRDRERRAEDGDKNRSRDRDREKQSSYREDRREEDRYKSRR